ncbi:MAG: hypothetical protein HN590_07480, partial [Calditrichaeota bacterium]|nr:hypothetical protein [Calditrichota bacterium]
MRVNNVKTILVVLYVSVFFLLGNQTLAEWGRTAHDYLDLPLGRGVSLCADGNGGCWATASSAVFFHIDRYGNFSWGGESFWILPEPGFNPEMALADNGDLIVAMDVPLHEEMSKVYVQRIN